MKLYIESYQSKLDDLEPLETENTSLKSEVLRLKDQNSKLSDTILKLK